MTSEEALKELNDGASPAALCIRLIASLEAAEEQVAALVEALARLIETAETYSADQSGATDMRCGIVQPVSVAEAEELNDALEQARSALSPVKEAT